MTAEAIHSIADRGAFPGLKAPVQIMETHISWVLLTPVYAFKIKKPLRLSFLDFSTLEQRAFYCQEEVRLNRRLAPDLYLGILSIQPDEEGQLAIMPMHGDHPVLDFAVWMRRVDNSRQMDLLLERDSVRPKDVEALARLLARFHREHILETSAIPSDTAGMYRNDFEDLLSLAPVAARLFGAEAEAKLDAWRKRERHFLETHGARLEERARTGFWVDGHGDLHARNIFLLRNGPVVFDCIEFDAHLRRLDVLNELAFLVMDLETRGHAALAQAFMAAYLQHWKCMEDPEDEQLLQYFKAYRANVRLKIALLQWEQDTQPKTAQMAKRYWQMLEHYTSTL